MRPSSYNDTSTGKAVRLDGAHPSPLVPVVSRCRGFHPAVANPHRRGDPAVRKPDASPPSLCRARLSSPAARGRASFPAGMVAAT
jgi:hypothetical protein